MTSYAKATDASGRQSLRGDIVNTATTRAQSLALIIGDTNAVKHNISLVHGTRQLLNQCPVIPLNDLLNLLKIPCEVEYLNDLLENNLRSDKKRGAIHRRLKGRRR